MEQMDEKMGKAVGEMKDTQTVPEGAISDEEILYMAAARVEQFDLRSKVGGWWSKAVKNDEELKRKYAEIGKNYNAQHAFRQKWAAEKAEELKVARTVTEASIDVTAEDAPDPHGVQNTTSYPEGVPNDCRGRSRD